MVVRFAKTIKLFLMDGNPNSRISCELSNWSGKAYKIPRIEIKNCSDRSDLMGTGVYPILCSKHTRLTSTDRIKSPFIIELGIFHGTDAYRIGFSH